MMAHKMKVYLGYEDEIINEQNRYQVNFTTNKIGGKPDWPFIDEEPKNPTCLLCGLNQILIVQIYAPLDNSMYHRTLYVFACINPNCWNQNESWTCLRSQYLDQSIQISGNKQSSSITSSSKGIPSTEWIQDADDWGSVDDNIGEENGNLITSPTSTSGHKSDIDDEDESYSIEDTLRAGLEELCVDKKNANNGKLLAEAQGGAVGKLPSPTATAEIEGEESEIVSIDTPTIPQRNLLTLLQEVTPLPPILCMKNNKNQITEKVEFCPVFVSVSEEENEINNTNTMSEHIRDLINEYQMRNEQEEMKMVSDTHNTELSTEKYEQSSPIHGDKLFHYFITQIQMNPGQILRYSRGNPNPLIIAPINEFSQRLCQYCQSEMIFEMQILPTLIPKLHLNVSDVDGTHVEFGNVLIFTCNKSCWKDKSDSVRQEYVIVQCERY